jgi:predicted acyltransferase
VTAQGPTRLASLDAFRGFTIAAMLLVNNPGDWNHLYGPLEHAKWNGWTFTDWIFPFFLFIGGVAMTLSLGRLAEGGADKGRLLRKLWARAAIIFAIGFCLNLVPKFDFEHVRILGVLQRIALCTALAAPVVVYCNWRQQALVAGGLLLVYGAVMMTATVPDAAGVLHTGALDPGMDFGAWLDRLLFGKHLWVQSKTWDPEGLFSSLPAVASQLAGVLAGRVLAAPVRPSETAARLAFAGMLALWLGAMLDLLVIPINKSLWTPSYAVFTTGWALVLFAAFYWLLDGVLPPLRERLRRLVTPLTILGMNALFLFALSGFIGKMMGLTKVGQPAVSVKSLLFAPFKTVPAVAETQSLLYALWFVLLMFLIAWLMWRRRWFIKV